MHGPGVNQRLSLESFRRVKPGDPVSASLTNQQSSAIERVLSSLNGGAQPQIYAATTIVTVKNGTGSERRDGDCLALTGQFYDDPENQLKNGTLAFTAGQISDPDEQHCVVLRQITPDGSAAPGQGIGYCKAWVNIVDADHEFAKLKASSYALESAPTGSIKIIWKPTSGGETGEKKCAVVIGLGASGCGIRDIEVLAATSGRPKGIYKYFCSDPDAPVLVAPIRTGHCPSSSGSAPGCSTDGYAPGGTWVSGELHGYNAAWYSSDCDEPAAPPAGEWILVPITIGETTYCVYRNLTCGWIAYGGGYIPS